MEGIGKQVIVEDVKRLNILCISVFVGIINNFFYANYYIMLGLVILELLILCCCLIKGRWDKFLCYYVLFLSSSLENSFQISGKEVEYGFKAFKILGINISVYVILFFLLCFIKKYKIVFFFEFRPLRNLQIGSLLLIPIGLISGIISITNNYNSIRSYKGHLGDFFRWGYTYALIALEIFIFSQVIYRSKSIKIYKEYMLYIAIGQISAALISHLFCNYNYAYGEIIGFIAPITLVHLIYLIMFPMYKEYSGKQKLCIFFASVVNILNIVLYAGGQKILMVAIIPFIMILIYYENREKRKLLLFIMFCVSSVGIAIIIFILLSAKIYSNTRVSEELGDVLSMVSFWKSGWIDNMHHSPKVRIVEIINIIYEYIRQPFSFFLGRGFLGTYRDNLRLLDIIVPSDYLMWERKLGSYSSVHESFTQFLLYFGLYGVFFYVNTLKNIIVNISKSPWLLIGLAWFALHYAFSMTAISYGAFSLVIGFFDVWNKKQNL